MMSKVKSDSNFSECVTFMYMIGAYLSGTLDLTNQHQGLCLWARGHHDVHIRRGRIQYRYCIKCCHGNDTGRDIPHQTCSLQRKS